MTKPANKLNKKEIIDAFNDIDHNLIRLRNAGYCYYCYTETQGTPKRCKCQHNHFKVDLNKSGTKVR